MLFRSDDFFVKVRMVAGGFQAVARNWRALLPPRSWFAAAFLSHKLLRWLMPEALIAIFALSLLLCAEPFYALLAVLFVSRYLAKVWSESITVRRECNRLTARVGETVSVLIHLRNSGRIPVAWMLCEDVLPANALAYEPPSLRVSGRRMQLTM